MLNFVSVYIGLHYYLQWYVSFIRSKLIHVRFLYYFQVAWIHTDRYTLLTLQNRVITRNSRYKVTHNSHRTWWLHISEVQERDKGEYMCQINTSPMKSQTGYIEVVGEFYHSYITYIILVHSFIKNRNLFQIIENILIS